MSTTPTPSSPPEADVGLRSKVAIYARVSSAGQLGRDGDDGGDGYSIPAQVQACTLEAERMGCEVEKAYVERAESARSDDRPVLQQMLRELPTLGVEYLIVHKVDRLARNRLDDALLYQKLVGMNVTLVSATEKIDHTPAGRLMHGMLATFAEYYSNNLSTEIKKGLRQKHAMGGTPGRPPIGYRPVGKLIEGREVRTVEVDPDRGPLVALAFELYATGNWSLSALTEHMRLQGLIARPTAKQGGKPLSRATLHATLKNPYYKGIVEYAGKRVVGRHEPLVSPETFDQVQAVLTAARQGGDRSHKHDHFLRGFLYCAECGGRLLYSQNTGNGGTYAYWFCTNRAVRKRKKTCHTGHYSVEQVERAVERLYKRLQISDADAQRIRDDVAAELEERHQIIHREAAKHRKRIEKITAHQAKLAQLFYDDLVSEDVLRSEQERLKDERAAAERLLDVVTIESEEVDGALTIALDRAANPARVYADGTPMERRILTGSFFQRIEIGPDQDATETVLTPVYEALKAWKADLGQPVQGSTLVDYRPPGLINLVYLSVKMVNIIKTL